MPRIEMVELVMLPFERLSSHYLSLPMRSVSRLSNALNKSGIVSRGDRWLARVVSLYLW